MIFLSSFRPNAPLNSEYHNNQRFAFESWNEVAENIVYLNDFESYLSSGHTLFIPHENFPRIWEMAELLSYQTEWGCIVNSDIVITANFVETMALAKRKNAKAVTSWRYEFDPTGRNRKAHVVDMGIDFFAATPEIWRQVAKVCPDHIRLGCQQWDSWMLGALNVIAKHQFFAITKHQCVFHPKHSGRKYGYDVGTVKDLGKPDWPVEI